MTTHHNRTRTGVRLLAATLAATTAVTLASCGDDEGATQPEGQDGQAAEEQPAEPVWPTSVDPLSVDAPTVIEERAVAVSSGDCGVWKDDLQEALRVLAKTSDNEWENVEVGDPTPGQKFGAATTCDYPVSGMEFADTRLYANGSVNKVTIAMLPKDSNAIGKAPAAQNPDDLDGVKMSAIGQSAVEKIKAMGLEGKKSQSHRDTEAYSVGQTLGFQNFQGRTPTEALDMMTVDRSGHALDRLESGAWVSVSGTLTDEVSPNKQNTLLGVANRINKALVYPVQYTELNTWRSDN